MAGLLYRIRHRQVTSNPLSSTGKRYGPLRDSTAKTIEAICDMAVQLDDQGREVVGISYPNGTPVWLAENIPTRIQEHRAAMNARDPNVTNAQESAFQAEREEREREQARRYQDDLAQLESNPLWGTF